jgi:type I restriction enzyme M protein
VLFIDASREFEESTNQNNLGKQHIAKIVGIYQAYKTVDKYAYRAKPSEIKKKEFNLNIPRYVDTYIPEKDVDLKAVEMEIATIETELAAVRKEMARYLGDLGL